MLKKNSYFGPITKMMRQYTKIMTKIDVGVFMNGYWSMTGSESCSESLLVT